MYYKISSFNRSSHSSLALLISFDAHRDSIINKNDVRFLKPISGTLHRRKVVVLTVKNFRTA